MTLFRPGLFTDPEKKIPGLSPVKKIEPMCDFFTPPGEPSPGIDLARILL